MFRFRMGPLMESEPGAAGAGVDETKINTMINGALARFAKDVLPGVVTEANKGLNANFATLTENLTNIQTMLAASQPKPKEGKEGNDDGLTPALRARFEAQEKAIKTANDLVATEKTAREAAEKKSRDTAKESAIRESLGQFTFASTDAAEDAFTLLQGKVDWDEQGNLIAEGLPVKDFVTNYIPEKKSHLLQVLNKGGSGAQPGIGRQSFTKVDMDDIKPGMTLEQTQRSVTAILNAIPGARTNR